jgi:hypothetical protein
LHDQLGVDLLFPMERIDDSKQILGIHAVFFRCNGGGLASLMGVCQLGKATRKPTVCQRPICPIRPIRLIRLIFFLGAGASHLGSLCRY